MRSLVTVGAFAAKEIRQVLRQPKLMAALVLGPFIILGLFAVGFQASPPPLRTVVVLPEGSNLESQVADLGDDLGRGLDLVGTTTDAEEAMNSLLADEVDLVVVAPDDPAETIRNDEHATIKVYHTTLEPFDRAFITVAARSAVDEINRYVVAQVVDTTRERAADYEEALTAARESVDGLAAAVRQGDEVQARDAQQGAIDALATAEQQLGLPADVLDGVERSAGSEAMSLGAPRSEIEAIDVADPGSAERLDESASDLADLEEVYSDLQGVSAEVLVQPFVASSELVQGADVPVTTYYSPGVVAVLLQHVVLTFAALSVVSERSTGSTEMFRVGPVRVSEFMVGKFLGYAVIGVVTGAALIALVVYGFGTPMLGSWGWVAVVLALTMSASLGLGFVIAAAANTYAQAVQYSMLALLFTIFLSGMVVSLSRLSNGVRQIAYLAPATSGTEGLQDVMFRGAVPDPLTIGILGAYTVLSLVIAYAWLQRRQVA